MPALASHRRRLLQTRHSSQCCGSDVASANSARPRIPLGQPTQTPVSGANANGCKCTAKHSTGKKNPCLWAVAGSMRSLPLVRCARSGPAPGALLPPKHRWSPDAAPCLHDKFQGCPLARMWNAHGSTTAGAAGQRRQKAPWAAGRQGATCHDLQPSVVHPCTSGCRWLREWSLRQLKWEKTGAWAPAGMRALQSEWAVCTKARMQSRAAPMMHGRSRLRRLQAAGQLCLCTFAAI